MKAVTFDNQQIRIAEVPEPECGSEDLLVKVRSAGINAADILQKRGLYPAPAGIPQDIPGLEFSGEVVKVGSKASGFKPGDRVTGIVGGGAQAELTTIHYSNALLVPESVDLIDAGGFSETYLTAYDALVRQAGLQMGEKVLINGAAGGVGLSAVTIATMLNARVTASARHLEHHQHLKSLGATPVLPEKVSEAAPFDVILELVGGINMEQNVSNLGDDGRISVIGVGAGAKCEIDLRLVMSKRARIFGSTLRARSTQSKAALVNDARTKLIPLLDQGKLPITVAGRFDFREAAKAYESFSTPGKLGKILLTF